MLHKKLAGLSLLAIFPAFADERPVTLAACANIIDNSERLACFDRLVVESGVKGSEEQDQAQVPHGLPSGISTPEPGGSTEPSARYSLQDHWELGPQHKRGILAFRPHQPNYLLAVYNPSPNNAPYRPFQSLAPEYQGLSHTEIAFQLGFKMKLVENALHVPADIWFAYTQKSFWQASNRKASSPFRETNYQPELMAVLPVSFRLLGMNARFINVGLVHQSNGQASALSRSWDRLYAQVGMEKGDFSLLGRVWKRIHDENRDDNPDILDYMGHGDLVGTYRWRGHEFSALARYNFRTNRGAAELGWAFPLVANLKGYVQVFSGYGQSLIDYNYSQKTIGLGVSLSF